MMKENSSEAEKKHRTATGQSVMFSSNEVRLSVFQWLFAFGVVGVLLYFVPIFWVRMEQFESGSDYRFPYQLSNDYWLYSSYCREVCAEEKTVILGDSVMWGQYVKKNQTLAHYLNKLGEKDSFVNLGIDGAHPSALCGLIEYYGGAISGKRGESAIHTHMTNTLNTPIESLETSYPLRIWRYAIRQATGGAGKWQGGDGITREIELLSDYCTVSIQSERRHSRPWGLKGGEAGVSGKNSIVYDDQVHELQAKTTVTAPEGAIIRIETPGGGGWGKSAD